VNRSTEAGLERIRSAVSRQLGTGRPATPEVDPAGLVRFSPDLPEELSPDRRAELAARAEALHPWLQGPFLLGGDLVVGGAWRTDGRWAALGPEVPDDLSDTRVLDVGSNAGYDAFMFNLRGAREVVACEPFDFYQQALFLESIYRTGIDFRQIGWEELDPADHGRFALVHCNGVLYHERDPLLMLRRLRAMLADDGLLLLGSMVLAELALADHMRFVPGSYFGDPTWWWVPGRMAIRQLLAQAGLRPEGEFGLAPGPPGEFATSTLYIRARPES
jgi:SAM-dependent methyltransferase